MSLPKMLPHSLDPREALLTELRQKFPEVFTEGQIDIGKLENFLQSKFNDDKDRYRMTWAGRKEAIRQVQVKTTDTLVPDPKQSVDFDTTENVFIEGDNLEVLRVLQKSYYGKVKMIYIDPPYNTGNDFIYNDDFKQNKAQYQEESGMKSDEGNVTRENVFTRNSKDQGHYHSDWLSMMFPRLYLAKNLLRHDGVIFVSIDDNEAPRLRLLMDEIFGEENFVTQITWKRKKEKSNDAKGFAVQGEYILAYSRSEIFQLKKESLRQQYIDSSYSQDENGRMWRPVPLTIDAGHKGGGYEYEITTPSGLKIKKQWRLPELSFKELVKENLVYFGKNDGGIPQRKKFLDENSGTSPSNVWDDIATNKEGKKEILRWFEKEIFDTPKPPKLIEKLAELCLDCNEHDIVLDFFAGSGTTAQAVMQLNTEDGGNRKWICVQLDERCDQASEAYKAGYQTIADIARERIRRAGKKIQEENKGKTLDVGFKAFRLAKSNFPVWQGTIQDEHDLLEQMGLFASAKQQDARPIDLLYEVILKEGLDINIDVQLKETSSGSYYLVNQGKLVVSFATKLLPELMDAIFLEKPEKIILLESAFIGNDELKMNTFLHAQTLKVDIRVI